tara:strand:- start:2230 stop:3375 length:1146 start_codon:yes stop_codon:yes gene_type:complete
MIKKVLVSGCFDMIHSGHIEFFKNSSKYGELYVCIGSDKTIKELKGLPPITNQDERKFIIDSVKYVKKCVISRGAGILDFKKELIEINPDFLIVNKDGDSILKQNLCKKHNIEYKVLDRLTFDNLPKRSSTEIKKNCIIPYRIDLAGGWLDQKFVNNLQSGPVITLSLEPTHNFNLRSGMATSTRNKAIELWNSRLPHIDNEKLSKILFCFDNPPGTKVISGSQDSIGIIFPGINKLNYNNNYWPFKIESIKCEDTILLLEENLYLIPLNPRVSNYDVLINKNITKKNTKKLADSSEKLWKYLILKDLEKIGKCMTDSFKSQVKMFPNMINQEIIKLIDIYKNKCLGYKISGAGGGGYLILLSKNEIKNSIKVKIRRNNNF